MPNLTSPAGRWAASQVLYIHPAKQGVGFDYLRRPADPAFELMPLGVVGMLNLLGAEGLRVHGISYGAERFIDPTFDLTAWLQQHQRPRLIVVDLHWYEHCYGALDVVRHCKRVFPQTPAVLGGLTASGYAAEILQGMPAVDAIICGDGEEPLRQIAVALCRLRQPFDSLPFESIPNVAYRRDGRIICNELAYVANSAQLDALDWVNTDWLDHEQHYRGFQYVGNREPYVPADGAELLAHWLCLGRGCVYDCSYCGGGQACHQQLAGRPKLVARAPEAVADDLQRLAELGVQQAALGLDPLILGAGYWQALLGSLHERGARIGIYNEVFQLPNTAFIREFAATVDLAHSELGITVLSHETVRRRNGKHYSDAQLFRALATLRKERVPLSIYFSLNLPGERLATFDRTLALAERIGRHYPAELLRLINQAHTVDPWSAMSREPETYGLEVSFSSFAHYFQYCRDTAMPDHATSLDERHGFRMTDRPAGEVEQMAQQWQAFCRRQPFVCA